MSATGFHPEPSAKAPWTRTMVLTAAYAGDDAARAAPVRRARIMRFMVHLRYKRPLEIAIYRCAPQLGFLSSTTPRTILPSAPCCSGRRPRQTTTELRVIGLGYVKWSAEQADISAANSLILTQPKLVQVKPTLDLSDVSSDVGGRKFDGRNRCYSSMSTSTVSIFSIVKLVKKPRRSLSSCTVFRLHHTSIAI